MKVASQRHVPAALPQRKAGCYCAQGQDSARLKINLLNHLSRIPGTTKEVIEVYLESFLTFGNGQR